MQDLRRAGVLGATVILAGGVAYLLWRHSEKKPRSRPETPSGAGRAGEEAVVERQAERLSAPAAPPVIEVTPAPKAAQVGNFHTSSSAFIAVEEENRTKLDASVNHDLAKFTVVLIKVKLSSKRSSLLVKKKKKIPGSQKSM